MTGPDVNDELRKSILNAARSAICACVAGARGAEAVNTAPDDIDATGVFVTIHVDGLLRGCIGFVDINAPFSVCLTEAAQRAALEDPRFPSIAEDELDRMNVEVTLLAPQEPIQGPEDIEPGTHGIRIDYHGKRGLLLPQVAIEQKWTNDEFLAGVCRKAYLPEDAWKNPDARLTRFRGIVLREGSRSGETSEQTERTT